MLTRSEKFYFDGYGIGSFKEGENLKNITKHAYGLFAGSVATGFSLDEKYPFSRDLRPNVYEYDESFINILFESDLPNKFKETLGYDLFLAHVQCRVVSSNTGNSYMQWHRDTHYYDKKLAGNAPPVHKVIFYPSVNGVSEPCLQVAKGSHLRMETNMEKDFSQLHHSEIDTVASSDNKYVFFNTSLLHYPIIPSVGSGNVRVIYSFCHEFQLEKYPDQKELHNIYKQKMINYRRGDK